VSRRDAWAIVVLGFVGYYFASFVDFLGLQYISAGLGRLILFVYPTLVVLLSMAFLHKRPTSREVVALGITYSGIALVMANAAQGANVHLALGAALCFASAAGYAVYLVASSQVVQRVGSMRFTAYAMSVASAFCILQFLLLRPMSALTMPVQVYGLAIAMAILATVLPVFITSEALKRIGANQVALFGALGPVTTLFFGWMGLDEVMTPVLAVRRSCSPAWYWSRSRRRSSRSLFGDILELNIRGKAALVCGASKGLGRGCAVALAREGCRVTLVARDRAILEKTAEEMRATTGATIVTVPADITSEQGRIAALAACPQPDILITNAGGPPPGDFRKFSREDWQKAVGANMLTPIELIKATVDGMISRRFGRTINTTSSAVKAPIAELAL
jgi:drug/metabolite transporter (DMT)-like permease